MRILLISDSFAPRLDGVAIAVWREAQRYAGDGNQVMVLAVSTDPQAAKAQCEGVCDVTLLTPHLQASSGYPTRLFNGPKVKATIESFQPDLIRIHTIGPLGSEGLLAGRKRGIPMEMFWHTDLVYYGESYPATALYLTSRLARADLGLYRYLVRGPQAFFRATLSHLLQAVRHIDVPSLKSEKQVRWFDYMGAVAVKPTPAAIAAVPRDVGEHATGKHVAYVGRVSREKNLPLLLKAFEILVQTDPQVRLSIAGPVGDARTRRMLTKWLRSYDKQAVWTGAIPREQVAQMMASADVVAIPSLSETQCLVIGEARSVGVPVVMVDADLALSYADDAGVMVAEPTPAALAAGIASALAEQRN